MFVMSFTASAFAIHAEIPAETAAVVAAGSTLITLGGEIRTRGWWTNNRGNIGTAAAPNISPVSAPNAAWYDQRIRLSLDAKIASDVQGYVQLESGAATASYGANQSDTLSWGNFNSKIGGMNILQAWILYKNTSLFGFGSGLKVGHMPLALGEKMFFDHTKFGDDAIVFFIDPTKDLHIGVLTIKLAEFSTADNTDDTDAYVGLFTYKIDAKNTVGANYTYLNNSDIGMGMSNLGLHGNGKISSLGWKAEVDFQFGDVVSGAKAKGWAFMGGLSYMLDTTNLRGTFAAGSGQKAGSDFNNFISFLDNGVLSGLQGNPTYSFVYEYLIKTASGRRFSGLENTTYFNVGADFTPAKDLKASVDGYIFRATKSNTAVGGSSSKDAGWEVDGKLVYSVAKNLTYQVDAGYFKAGNLYGVNKANTTALRHMLTLSF
jgi:hypothetical protein